MAKNNALAQKHVVILIAPEFDEEMVVHCLYQMRRQGTAVHLIGTPSNLIVGASGLTVRPDFSLAQLNQVSEVCPQVIIIPGGTTCATTLLSDPRVHQAIQKSFNSGGYVATTSPVVSQILTNMGLLSSETVSQFLVKGTQSIFDFVKSLIWRIG